MQALLSLFIFSLLLAAAACLECETCFGHGDTCNGSKQTCLAGLDTCLTLVLDVTAGGQTATSVVKSCYSKAACNILKQGGIFGIPEASGTIKAVTCKAAGSPASFLLALSGLLLLKIFF